MLLGCRWSIIYTFAGITTLLIAINGIVMTFGAWNIFARTVSGCCCCLLSCVNLAAMIVTCIFRFNTMGKLAAISLGPTKYNDQLVRYDRRSNTIHGLSDKRTYSGDAEVILFLWIAQVSLCCSHCLVMGYVAKPPSSRTPID